MSLSTQPVSAFAPGVPANVGPFEAIVIGASFGGPKAVEKILSGLPKYFPVPIAVCQHMTEGMTGPWADRLEGQCALTVREGEPRAKFTPGLVYVAPAGRQMRLRRGPLGSTLRVDPDFADSLHIPSIDILFSSAAEAFGSRVLAVLLTGLGNDGALGMLRIRQAGGYTIAESEATAASHSMPGSAVDCGGVVEELPLPAIAKRVLELGSVRA
jgi:two-component system chemotaxis response regulator CheB